MNKKLQLGILKYTGRTHFADGEWSGILLDEPCGKNDGSVRGVRYFRCRNKHGIFVHSQKVKCADETTLSRLNLLEGFSSPDSSEKREKIATESETTMASSDVQFIKESHTVYKHRDVKTLRLTRRNRSVSLDRYLFLKTKQLAKNLNVLIHSADKGDKADTRELNRINRSVSLPKINKGAVCDSNDEMCLASEMAPLEKNQQHEGCVANREQTADPRPTNTTGVPPGDKLNKFDSTSLNISGGRTVSPKVGHAVSLDTHLMIENGQLTVTTNGTKEEFCCQSHAGNKEDPFIQGRHCSCPSLHCADHFSEAITTCLDLGRTERSVIHETSGENNFNFETAHVAGIPHNAVHSHSQSEAMEKLFQKSKVVRSASSSSRDPELGRKGSWPWVTSTPKRSPRSYGSSDNIDTTGTGANGDVFDEGFGSILAQVKLISGNIVEKHSNLERVSGDANITSVNKAIGSMPLKDQADSNYPDSLSGSQASLSSTGTNDSKGKKISSKKRIPSSAKGSRSNPKSVPSSGMSVPKATQKQSRLEQMRQQQQNRQGSLSSSVNKPHVANKTGATAESKGDTKIAKRHTLAAITDVTSFVPRPTVNKRPMSIGMTVTAGRSDKEETLSKLPVKKVSTSSQFSRPAALPKVEKTTEKASSVQRRHSAATHRPPVLPPVKRNSSVAQSDSKSRKPSNVTQKSTGKDKELLNVGGKKTVGGQTLASAKGAKEVTVTGPKPQTSRVTRSSSTAKGNSTDLCCCC